MTEKIDKEVGRILDIQNMVLDDTYFSYNSRSVVMILDKIREITGKCALLEASVNPKEYLCTVGWHHRGQWLKDFQVSADTAPLVVCLALIEANKDFKKREG